MRQLAPLVRLLAAENPKAKLARVVSFQGIGGRRPGEALLVCEDGSRLGELLGGLADATVSTAPSPVGLIELPVGFDEAVEAGLACGGLATVLVNDLELLPAELWDALEKGRPVAIVTRAEEASPGAIAFVEQAGSLEALGSLGSPDDDEEAEQLARAALRTGREATELRTAKEPTLVVEIFLPVTSLVVLGTGELADALAAQGELLGWSVHLIDGWGEKEAAAISSLGPHDAVVVLSHNPLVDTPALAAALATSCYVGALGARHTQAARRERLGALGLEQDVIARLHGPVGLNIGARAPEETALAITAEVLAYRSGQRAESLSTTTGPIHP